MVANSAHSLAHFVSAISSETITENEIMVSCDVESLFTNIPIDAAVQATPQKLESIHYISKTKCKLTKKTSESGFSNYTKIG